MSLRPILSISLLALYVACHSCTSIRPPEPMPDPALRVMTFNLDVDAQDVEPALLTIERANPDVICFQEVSPRWEQTLAARFGHRLPEMRFVRPPNPYGGAAVLSRFPIRESEEIGIKQGGWFPAQRVVIETPLGLVQILNVHLRPPATDGGNKVIGVFTAGGPRKQETAALLTHLRPDIATIVVGDFNEGDHGGSVSLVKSKGFTDCLPQFDAHTPTWKMPSGLIRLSERADHVLHSADLHCTEAKVIPEASSDHDPVLAILGRKK